MSKVPLIRFVVFLVVIAVQATRLIAQPSTEINLIRNGDFESTRKNTFFSEYREDESCSPGSYVVTSNIAMNNPEMINPEYGDHTGGDGAFLVCNSDGYKGRKIWCSNAKVVPNARYEFTAYFCNVYALLPPKTSFSFEEGDAKGNDPELKVTIGTEVIALEKDIYHLFRWIKVTGTWYSGKNSTYAQICLENTNLSVNGNDMAIDDISFMYIETMPEGYKPPHRTLTLVDRYYVAPPDTVKKKTPLSAYGEFEYPDTVVDGVYVLHPKPWHPIIVDPEPVKVDSNIYERIALHSLSFDQTKAELKESAKAALDLVAQWMKRDEVVRIRFIGHTDNQGDPARNVKLSEERVSNVKKYLVDKGIAADRIETVGYGGAFPIADNSREDSRKLNRRVEMEILSK